MKIFVYAAHQRWSSACGVCGHFISGEHAAVSFAGAVTVAVCAACAPPTEWADLRAATLAKTAFPSAAAVAERGWAGPGQVLVVTAAEGLLEILAEAAERGVTATAEGGG